MRLSEIKANPNNPRIINDDKFNKLKKSIEDFPKMMDLRPIVVDVHNMVLGGNMRLKALEDLGYKEIPDTWVKRADDLTEDEKKEFIIKDNVGFGEWEWEMLANEWNVDDLTNWGLDIPIDYSNYETALDDDFEINEDTETDIVLGDFFEIGEHRLLCADSTKIESYEILFKGQLADLVVTDPPYNVSYEGKTKDALTIENDSMDDSKFYEFLFEFYSALGTYTKPGGSWYVWHADSEGANFRLAMKNAGIMVKQCLIWVKNSMVMGRQDYQWKHEPCLYGWKEGVAHNWYSDRKQTTILEFDRPTRNQEHPTMKPIPLIAYQIENSSKVGDIVADGFGGSGTTMVASDKLRRKCYMIELSPKYCQVIIDRMRALVPEIVIKKNGIEI